MKKNILIFPCGEENSINIYNSLKYNIHFELFGATSKIDHSKFIFDDDHLSIDNYMITDTNFFKVFNKMLNKFKIDYIIPTHDIISTFLMKNKNKIMSTIICSPLETCETAMSKIKTFKKLKSKNYIPKIYNIKDKIEFPVFLKPDVGAGSKGTFVVNNIEELKIKYNKDILISEYLPGKEITVDCFTDRNRNLLFIGPRTRERITTGVSFNSKNIKLTKEIERIAKDLNETFIFRGMWFFQLKKDINNKYKLMEFCIRPAGTMALYRQTGINFAALSIFDFMNYDLSLIYNDFSIELDRYYKCCYKNNLKYENVYIDFDDTMIINNKVNSEIMKFIYQCLNQNKNIYLITKHENDIYEDLKKFKIDKDIFIDIIIMNLEDKKYKKIIHKNSIFIDNYFNDRKLVFENLKIPVFDVDAVESLINESEL